MVGETVAKVGASVVPMLVQVVPMLVPETLYAKPKPPILTRGPQMPALSVKEKPHLHSHNLPTISPRRRALSSRSVSSGRCTYVAVTPASNPNSVGMEPDSSLSSKPLHPQSRSHQLQLAIPHSQKSQLARAGFWGSGVWVVHSQLGQGGKQPNLGGDRP